MCELDGLEAQQPNSHRHREPSWPQKQDVRHRPSGGRHAHQARIRHQAIKQSSTYHNPLSHHQSHAMYGSCHHTDSNCASLLPAHCHHHSGAAAQWLSASTAMALLRLSATATVSTVSLLSLRRLQATIHLNSRAIRPPLNELSGAQGSCQITN